jgi:Zn-dependent peptidase ImmA (M78 family)
MEATRLHRDLKIDPSRPVDVFGVAQMLGIWLMAQPLDRLYGCYLRTAQAAGIAVNSQHPESLQRFTVAHEIGHHVLGHHHTVDDHGDVASFTGNRLEEAQAQVFAASLLLPLPLINRVLRQFPSERALRPPEVYLFSRQTGVSYSAAVWQLRSLKKLTTESAQSFAKRGAAAAKTELRGRNWVSDARADVWLLGPAHSGVSVVCRVGDEIHVRLPESLSTGHAWRLDESGSPGAMFPGADPQRVGWTGDTIAPLQDDAEWEAVGESGGNEGLSLEVDEHVAYNGATLSGRRDGQGDSTAERELEYLDDEPRDAEDSATGVSWPVRPELPGSRALVFVPREQGSYQICLSLRPVWDPAASPVTEYRIGVRARPRARIDGQGIVHPTKEAWVNRKARTR